FQWFWLRRYNHSTPLLLLILLEGRPQARSTSAGAMPFTISLATMWRRNLVLLIKGHPASVVSVAAGGVAGIGGIGAGAGAMGCAGLGSTLLKGPSSMRSPLPSQG